jgi:hypothetical protein
VLREVRTLYYNGNSVSRGCIFAELTSELRACTSIGAILCTLNPAYRLNEFVSPRH